MLKLRWPLYFICLSIIWGCATSPLGHRQLRLVSESEMNQLGTQAFEDMKKQLEVDRDPAKVKYIKCIVDGLASVIENGPPIDSWEVALFKSKEVNAFALPGGKVGVYTAMIDFAKTQDQLAAVLGHELSHVLAHHSNARVSETLVTQGGLQLLGIILADRGPRYDMLLAALGLGAQVGLILPNSRQQEREADLMGLSLMAKAGFDPEGAVQLWREMKAHANNQPPEFLSTHPVHDTRISYLQGHLADARKLRAASSLRPECALGR